MAPLKSRIVEKLIKGEFVPIGDLLRTKQAAPTTTTRQYADLGNGVKLSVGADASAASSVPKRTVAQPLDWLEAFTASVLPAQHIRVTQLAAASTDTELAAQLENMRQMIVHLCSAVCYFRRHGKAVDSANVVNFLEQQRRLWHNKQLPNNDLGTPESTAYMAMSTAATSSAAAHYSQGASGTPGRVNNAPASSAKKHPLVPGGKEVCGLFNQGRCRWADKCKFAHACSKCFAPNVALGHANCK
jgi:hypothetical protein